MPTTTYTPLANITLGSSASSVTFSNIPNTYRDLILVASVKSTTTGTGEDSCDLKFNGDTGSNYNLVRMYGNGSSAISNVNSNTTPMPAGRTGFASNNLTTNIFNIMDFSTTDKQKTVISRASLADSVVFAAAGRWANTAAITSIVVSLGSGNIASGSTFALYGVIA